MNQDAPLAEVAHVIQLAVAPVFLLTGIGALLGVLASRLARTVDRARVLEKNLIMAPAGRAKVIRENLLQQRQRARLTLGSISFCIAGALLISSVIVALFVGVFAHINLALVIAVGFVAALASLIVALLMFLREVYLATRYLRIGEPDPD
ncbi:DUF2721 domain-containing protein [Algiphilus sp. W345]|uniref:DUF2721 domain-containing protein n=1 Tax=Banduia mediterranea TaxID=3075609 RepID=A0ABU2WHD4_9GAMM|nr:DUF2721 domain-containing protein [Algiphilus sp. W345]MDT0497282.1 DUF2721 domain-containing protein [Algiphilus sp. W345]